VGDVKLHECRINSGTSIGVGITGTLRLHFPIEGAKFLLPVL